MGVNTMPRAGAPAVDGLFVPFRIVAAIAVALIVVQAVLAGQGLFGAIPGQYGMHGWLGNVSYLAAIVLALMALLGLRRGWGVPLFVVSALLVLLMTAQLGFGYMGRSIGWAAALHIPNGVLLTAVAGFLLAMAIVARPGHASGDAR